MNGYSYEQKKYFQFFSLNLSPKIRIYKRYKNGQTKSISKICNSNIKKFEKISLNFFVKCEICQKVNLL